MKTLLTVMLDLPQIHCKIIIWKAQGVPQENNLAHPKHSEEEETSQNKQKPHNYR